MAKTTTVKRKNQADATLRNVRACVKRLAALEAMVSALERLPRLRMGERAPMTG